MTSQLNKIADYWNQRSFGYSLDNQEELLHDQEKWIELINRYLKINKGMKVLDLGCGPGFFSVMLTNYGCQVIGIDYSDKMLEEARNNAGKFKANVEFQKMDVQNLAFQDETFDLPLGYADIFHDNQELQTLIDRLQKMPDDEYWAKVKEILHFVIGYGIDLYKKNIMA